MWLSNTSGASYNKCNAGLISALSRIFDRAVSGSAPLWRLTNRTAAIPYAKPTTAVAI